MERHSMASQHSQWRTCAPHYHYCEQKSLRRFHLELHGHKMGSSRSSRRILILAALLSFALPCMGAVSRTQAVSANADNATITSTANGDLIIVFAYNGSAAAAPSLASGFTSLDSGIATSQGMIIGYKVSSGGDTSTGTWTSATQVVCHVYAGGI